MAILYIYILFMQNQFLKERFISFQTVEDMSCHLLTEG